MVLVAAVPVDLGIVARALSTAEEAAAAREVPEALLHYLQTHLRVRRTRQKQIQATAATALMMAGPQAPGSLGASSLSGLSNS